MPPIQRFAIPAVICLLVVACQGADPAPATGPDFALEADFSRN